MNKVRKIIKVLAKKAKGLDRKEKIHEMNKGLTALGLVAMRQRRDGFGFPFIKIIEANVWKSKTISSLSHRN